MKGENLKIALEKKGISQRELADILGCSVNTVWRWCNDKQEVSDKIKKKLSEILDVSVSYLMGESGDFFLKIFDRKNLPKELASFFGVTGQEPLNVTDSPDEREDAGRDGVSVKPAFESGFPKSGLPDNRIIIETGSGKNKKRYILPATPESYNFLKQLESEHEISPEKSEMLKIMEGMTQEELRVMFDFISTKRV